MVRRGQYLPPNSAKELANAYRDFGCHLIYSTFEELELWSKPISQYDHKQLEEIQLPLPNMDDLSAVQYFYFFFARSEQETSGLEALIEGLELQLKGAPFVAKATPLLRRAFSNINSHRESVGLPELEFPKFF